MPGRCSAQGLARSSNSVGLSAPPPAAKAPRSARSASSGPAICACTRTCLAAASRSKRTASRASSRRATSVNPNSIIADSATTGGTSMR